MLTSPSPAAALDSGPRAFRLIAYDYKQRPEDTVSYAAYHANLETQILAAASEICCGPAPRLLFLPENTGLMAWFVGPRGEAAREAAASGQPDSSAAAIASLGPGYSTPIAYYQNKCPGITPARALILALTDTAWRALMEKLAAMAAQHGVWIVAGLNTADVTVTRDPLTVAALADPDEVDSGYAYEASCQAWNNAVVISPQAQLDPDGAADPANVLYGEQKKVYLVPIEREQAVGLTLSSESPANARAIDTGFARLGILTSKDAWMPDVVERLEIDGMDVFLQPEAGAWAGHGGGLPDWPPDAMARAIWSMVQWQAETQWGALSNLTGNLGDLYFDGTATITRDAVFDELATQYLLGRAPQPGIEARAPWVFPDPPPGVMLDDITARREFLDEQGARLAPGSGDALENGQAAGFVVADITLPDRGVRGAPVDGLGIASVAVSPTSAAQWSPSLAVNADGALQLAWTDLRDGHEQPYFARSNDAGATWTPAVRAGDAVFREFDQQDNQYDARIAAVADGSLQMVWSDFRNQSWDIYGARSSNGGATWPASSRVDGSPSSAEGFPAENIHRDPTVAAFADGSVIVCWADVRGMRTDAGIVCARSSDGATFGPDVFVDGTGDVESEQFAPAVAAAGDGRVLVAWQDHRDGIARIYTALSLDGGMTFEAAAPLAPSPTDQWQPAVAASLRGRFAVAWSQSDGDGGSRVHAATISRRGAVRTAVVDAAAPQGTRQARPSLAFAGSRLLAAWQDDRAGDPDVLIARLRSRGEARIVKRVDDDPNATAARLPVIQAYDRLAWSVAWEDDRSGTEQIRVASGDLADLR